jgi:hypothetical protein
VSWARLLAELVADFSIDRHRAIEDFIGSVQGDQDLVAQITPAATEVFNASTLDRPSVRYGCVVTCARGGRGDDHAEPRRNDRGDRDRCRMAVGTPGWAPAGGLCDGDADRFATRRGGDQASVRGRGAASSR